MSEIIDNYSCLILVKTEDGCYDIEFKNPELNYFFYCDTCSFKKCICTSSEKINNSYDDPLLEYNDDETVSKYIFKYLKDNYDKIHKLDRCELSKWIKNNLDLFLETFYGTEIYILKILVKYYFYLGVLDHKFHKMYTIIYLQQYKELFKEYTDEEMDLNNIDLQYLSDLLNKKKINKDNENIEIKKLKYYVEMLLRINKLHLYLNINNFHDIDLMDFSKIKICLCLYTGYIGFNGFSIFINKLAKYKTKTMFLRQFDIYIKIRPLFIKHTNHFLNDFFDINNNNTDLLHKLNTVEITWKSMTDMMDIYTDEFIKFDEIDNIVFHLMSRKYFKNKFCF
jgi:hypothetical protein